MDLNLADKVAVITGASKGIGLAVAKALAQEGVHIAFCGRKKDQLLKAEGEIKLYGVKVLGYSADITRPEDINKFVKAIKDTFGGADILINNAGEGTGEKIMEAPDEKWQYFWDLHVMGAIRMSRGLIPFMRERGGGVVINTASICARQPLIEVNDFEPVYNVTKAALSMFSKCLAHEVIKDNIRVNCINPGLIDTPDWHRTATYLGEEMGLTADEYLDKVAKDYTPIGRFASAEELSNFYVFLCSDRASYCVGSTYYVDGGWLKVVG
jgi:NAD(P)-dependent dehydrogenase (short-subunit alcohol dehydrogenase family)